MARHRSGRRPRLRRAVPAVLGGVPETGGRPEPDHAAGVGGEEVVGFPTAERRVGGRLAAEGAPARGPFDDLAPQCGPPADGCRPRRRRGVVRQGDHGGGHGLPAFRRDVPIESGPDGFRWECSPGRQSTARSDTLPSPPSQVCGGRPTRDCPFGSAPAASTLHCQWLSSCRPLPVSVRAPRTVRGFSLLPAGDVFTEPWGASSIKRAERCTGSTATEMPQERSSARGRPQLDLDKRMRRRMTKSARESRDPHLAAATPPNRWGMAGR
jgi:hypothetical protein